MYYLIKSQSAFLSTVWFSFLPRQPLFWFIFCPTFSHSICHIQLPPACLLTGFFLCRNLIQRLSLSFSQRSFVSFRKSTIILNSLTLATVSFECLNQQSQINAAHAMVETANVIIADASRRRKNVPTVPQDLIRYATTVATESKTLYPARNQNLRGKVKYF